MLSKEPKTMRPLLKSHFPADACTTLTTLLQQTKEARVFRRAQAVREVVVGSHVNAVSATFHFTNSALRKWVQRFAQHGPQGLRDRPRPGAHANGRVPSNNPSTASSIKTLCIMARSIPNGVVVNSRGSWHTKPGSTWAARASVAS